jgi:hypothetical protein
LLNPLPSTRHERKARWTPTTTTVVLTSSVEAIHVFMGRDERRKKTREMMRPGLLREERIKEK